MDPPFVNLVRQWRSAPARMADHARFVERRADDTRRPAHAAAPKCAALIVGFDAVLQQDYHRAV
jgi:hypothetical protein